MPASVPELAAARWDVVVVGAGHNGLTAAAYLARAGRRVLVVERRDVIGGAATMEELWPGYHISPCAYLVGLLHPRVVEDLELRRRGYRVSVVDPQLVVPFPDGEVFVEWRDPDRTERDLRRWAPDQVDGWRARQRFWDGVRAALRPPGDDDLWWGEPPSREEIERRLGGDSAAIHALFEASATEDLERFFTDRRLVDAYSGQGTIGTFAGPSEPGTASIAFHHSSGSLEGSPGDWGFVHGGMGLVSFALHDAAVAAGAAVAAEMPVAAIRPGRGVVLEDGTELQAPIVVSNADPVVTGRLLGDEVAEPLSGYLERLSIDSATAKVTYALRGLPRFTAGDVATSGMVTATAGTDATDDSCAAARVGELPDAIWGELYFQTVYDPSIAPPGRHVLSAFCQYLPHTFRRGTWDERRSDVAELVTEQIEALAPGFVDLVEAVHVDGPPDIEERIGLTGGHIFHGECLPGQMWDRRAPYRTGSPGVYLCGVGTHPGGSVIAANGRNAAMAVLADRA